MKITNNLLNDTDYYALAAATLGSDFPWFFQSVKVGENPNPTYQTCQFTHLFYDKDTPSSDFFNLIIPILEKLDIRSLIKIKANLTIGDLDPVLSGMHFDYPYKEATTGVYYINTNNGYTLFDNGKKIYSEKNKLLTFNSPMKHSGMTCSDEQVRVVINLNYF